MIVFDPDAAPNFTEAELRDSHEVWQRLERARFRRFFTTVALTGALLVAAGVWLLGGGL